MSIFDERRCTLGEGACWYAPQSRLYWVDILSDMLLWRSADGEPGSFMFERPVSAVGDAGEGRLIAADSHELFLWDIATRQSTTLCSLEPTLKENRANDGRADPWGGFWIGTMDKEGRGPTGTIYRYQAGELRALLSSITIPNALCFDRRRGRAYFTDTPTHKVWRLQCDDQGWPIAAPELHCDLSAQAILVDGAVTDREGNIYAACWDLAAVITISPEGQLIHREPMPTPRPTCVTFGGDEGKTLYVTSAAFGLDSDPNAGAVFKMEKKTAGEFPPPVIIEPG